ncbi:MAG: hypothetical protein ABI980_16040 [Nitrospirota bacterium]|jgi:hypothetical protein
MLAEVRGAFFLLVSLVFFLIIIGVFVLAGAAMRPVRWSERPRHAG